jgi:hypothetical protein
VCLPERARNLLDLERSAGYIPVKRQSHITPLRSRLGHRSLPYARQKFTSLQFQDEVCAAPQ